MTAMPAMPAMVGLPATPVKLTEGIPDPAAIAQQKSAYAMALDKQLATAMETVKKEAEIEKQMLAFTAKKNIDVYNVQVDERLAEQMATCDEQATFASLELKKALVERQLQLNNQATSLKMDYNMKAVQQDFAMKNYAFQQQYVKAEAALAQQYQATAAKAMTGTGYTAPAAAVRA